GDPRAHRREAGQDEAAVLHERGRAVDVALGHHGVEEADVIDTAADVRHQVADILAALAVRLPAPRALHARARNALEQFDLAGGVELLAIALDELRLVVEGIDLAGGTGHEELHHALGPGRMVQAAVELRIGGGGREQPVAAEELRKGEGAEAVAGLPEKIA